MMRIRFIEGAPPLSDSGAGPRRARVARQFSRAELQDAIAQVLAASG